jgi:hypothetical protein
MCRYFEVGLGLGVATSAGDATRWMAMHLFRKDSGGRSSCVAARAAAWPPVCAQSTPLTGPGLSTAKLVVLWPVG